MEFRRLTSADLASLLELYRQLDPDDDLRLSEQSEKTWKKIDENPDIRYFGAVDGGRVVSTCYAICIPNLTRNNRGVCFIENVVTDKEHRRLGLASRVLDMAISFAKERRCYKVILQSGINRTEAHRLYKSKGFSGESKKAFDMRLD